MKGKTVTSDNAADVLGDGVFSYNAGTKTLTVNGNCTYYQNIINSSIDGLIVNVTKTSVLKSTNTSSVIGLYNNTTIQGKGKLILESNYSAGLFIRGGTLTIKNANIDTTGGIGITGNTTGDSLQIIDSNVSVSCSNSAISNFDGGITLTGCEVVTPADYRVINGSVYNADGTTKPDKIDIRRPQPVNYELMIAEKLVTSANASDILGNGVFSYDDATKTLTVNGDCTPHYVYSDVILSMIDGLTINVTGDSRLTSESNTLSLFGDTTIFGNGALTIISPDAGIAVGNGADITIRNANIYMEGEYGLAIAYSGYYTGEESLKIINSEVTAKGTVGAVCSFGGGITLEGCRIISPSGFMIQNGTVYESDGTTLATEVKIGKDYSGALTAYDGRQITYNIDHSTGSVTIGGNSYVSGNEPVVVASYNAAGQMTGVRFIKQEGTAEAVIAEGAAKVKIMWWKTETMQPDCPNAVIGF